MRSNSALTYEVDDMQIAADELLEVLDGFTLEKNSLGILYCNAEVDVALLLEKLKSKLPFDIVGSLTNAVLDNKTGMNEFATNLLILTSDDCSFDVFASGPIDNASLKDQIESLCKTAEAEVVEEAKLILCHVPFIMGIILDDYADFFHAFTGGKPLFGGASCITGDGFTATLHNEKIYTDRLVTVFISGNVQPVFSVCSNISSSVRKMQIVTRSEDNVIYTVNNMSFIDYLKSVGIIINIPTEYELDFLLASVTLNLQIEDGRGNDQTGIYRSIFKLNFEDGSGIALGRIPVGSKICAVTYQKDDIELSAHTCLDTLLRQINENPSPNYAYSTILCGSCNGRYMFMFPTKNIEGDIITNYAPTNLNLVGYYTYGEICPTSLSGGIAVNRAHNATLTMCAI